MIATSYLYATRQNQIVTHECYATLFAIALAVSAINNYAPRENQCDRYMDTIK
ncbi:hypothetical protein HanXRQr2_Chr14g0652811 [Helianthus annuus]|uniref:Uncharacterized protein n=1 Tax=Helianthus annuus TaxID=4232 RepID=A0A9K3ECA0_HELAN|nr:hypothetical protein HanXRQr2_Chr14g0652811 [Helianthus annuus]KAJ0841055.1 hypothetical protein HanPSC8_Chr14g0626041 [Helianthus annuus]